MKLYPLTHAEKRIYITQKTWPESPMWNLVNMVRIAGGAHPVLLRRAIGETVLSHQSLRLGFSEEAGEIMQYDRGEISPEIRELDFIGHGGEKAFSAWLKEEQGRVLDIHSGSPHLFFIVAVSRNLTCLVVKLHHIAADGKTLAAVTSEVVRRYDAMLHGREDEGSGEKQGFLDTLALEKKYLASDAFPEDEKYWQKQFDTVPEPLELAPCAAGKGLRQKSLFMSCTEELDREIASFCARNHVSPFRLFLAALYTALARRSDREDMVIGSGGLNRRAGKIDDSVAGMFVSTLALRITCSLKMSFSDLLKVVRKGVRDGVAHEQYPYDRLVAWLRETHGELPDLIPVSLVQFFRPDLPEGYSAEVLLPSESTDRLTIYLAYDPMGSDSGQPVTMQIGYAADTLKEHEVRQIARHCMNILKDGMANPDRPLHSLNMLTEQEINQVLYNFNPPERRYPSGKTINELVEEQARIRPDHQAIVFSGRSLTYGQMNSMANQLARRLRSLGIGPDKVAGLWAGRSLEIVIAQLAILKAGGAFMPIDAEYPLERARFMIEDSNASVLVTQSHMLKHAGPLHIETILLDDPAIFQGAESNLTPLANEENLAVLIYTSGSTGKPKGVMIEHRSMTNMIFGCIEELHITEDDNVSKHLSFSFDASNLEIYPCLSAGGALHIIPEEIRLSLGELNSYYEENNITFAVLPTQLGEQFMEFEDNRSLRAMVVGGEKLRTFKERDYRLFNGYGPSECTVMSSMYHVQGIEDNIPIGRPLPNYKTLILDRFGNIRPVGVPGELCICGIPVARGYLNRPEKNKKAFGLSPLNPEERMYYTSDLAYWREDGNIVYLGRMDRQVKFRGYRVELGEIEQAIISFPDVKSAAVVDFRDSGGRVYLGAYVVADRELDMPLLKEHIGRSLPPFMIPAHFMQIEDLPLTPNGKVDKRKLPEPAPDTSDSEVFVPPEGDTEMRLAKIWQKIVEREDVGRSDNFFHVGGDSLKAVRLQLAIEKEFDVAFSMSDIFSSATLKEQAAAIETHVSGVGLKLVPAKEAEFYPLTVPQRQLYVLSCLKGSGVSYNMPFSVYIDGELDLKRLSDAIHSMVRDIEILRTAFVLRGGSPVMVVQENCYPRMEFAESDEAGLDAVIKGFIRPFNLEQPPLFRVKLIRMEEKRHCLLIDMHHIVSDGVSVAIVLRELGRRYVNSEEERPALQFRDFAVWKHEHGDEVDVGPHRAFWEETFKDPPEVELPTDRPHMPAVDFSGGSVEFAVNKDITARLREIAHTSEATMHHVLMSAISMLLGYYAESEDLVVGTTSAGRSLSGTEDMVGMFVNTLPVRVRPASDKTFAQLVKEVKETMLKVFDHQDYPIDLLYEKLGINRGTGRNPLFDVNFVLRNMEHSTLDLGNEIRTYLHLCDTGTAKFDLSFAAGEEASEDDNNSSGIIRFHLEYRTALYDRETVRRMSGHFLNILSTVAANPQVKLGDVEALHPDEYNFLLHKVNDTAVPVPPWASVARIFEENVRTSPGSLALAAGDLRLTYAELNQAANTFASTLIKRNFPADTVVAIMTDRSAATVVGMLGALKAGVAWVGIDPAYPDSRIRFILEDTAAPVVAGPGYLLNGLSFHGEKVEIDPLHSDVAAHNPLMDPAPDSLAYIIFTSGSTGRPKGVMIEHHSMLNFIDWYVRYNGISEDERCAVFASFSFDVSVAQVFAPLAAGAALFIIPEEIRRNPMELNDYFNTHSITHAHFPTQFAEQFMRIADNPSLRRMVVGGDSLKRYRLSHVRIINEYGPSETCMASTAISVQKEYEKVPVGAPISNTRVYVLGADNRLRPVGMAGELCIAGQGVARGYLNRPRLTAEKFVPDPFVQEERMFRTGDLARILPDGNVDFIGRRDFQVKIRGYRIEPGEIEKRIIAFPGVDNVVVVPFENPETGDKSLCACYEGIKPVSEDDMKKGLEAELPEYMVPGFFMHVEALPLNRNGKVDRKALPRPVLRLKREKAAKMPAGDKEKQIAAVWEKVLGFSGIGIHDNFFDVGGDSMKAIVLMVELQSILDITTNDVFNWPTVSEQAKNIPYAADTIFSRFNRLKDLAHRPDPLEDPEIREKQKRYMEEVRALDGLVLEERRGYEKILLTGATGTLGGYLLKALLEMTDAEIMLPVRADDNDHAASRIRDRLSFSFGPELHERHVQRVHAFSCDLSNDLHDLPENLYEQLSREVDCIVHSAANVRHAGEYEEFYKTNVFPVKQLLGLCETGGKHADFHYISTTSVGAGVVEGRSAVFFSEDDLDVGQHTDNVYVRSKLEAERLIHGARSRGVMAHVYRAGNITVDSRTGAFQKNIDENGFFQQLRAYLNLGAVPDALDVRNVSFVDCVAKAIVTLFDRKALVSQTFHIENPHLLKISSLLTSPELNLNVEKIAFDDFVDFIAGHYSHRGFAEYIERLMMHMGWVDIISGGEITSFVRPADRTVKLLELAGFTWPEPEARVMTGLLEHGYAERLGFFSSCPIFTDMDEEILLHLSKRARMRFTPDEGALFHEKEGSNFMAILVDGAAEVSRLSVNGWAGTLFVVDEKNALGISNLHGSSKMPWTVEAYDDLLWYEIKHADIRPLMEKNPRLAMNIIDELNGELVKLSRFVVALN